MSGFIFPDTVAGLSVFVTPFALWGWVLWLALTRKSSKGKR